VEYKPVLKHALRARTQTDRYCWK